MLEINPESVASILVYRHSKETPAESRCLGGYEIAVSGVIVKSRLQLSKAVEAKRPPKCQECGAKYFFAEGNSSIFIGGIIQK